jgi:ribitol 2-dehydrogenase
MPEALDGKVALVTGASSGIGLAIARELCRLGAHVVMAARSADRLQAAAAQLGDRCMPVVADVTDARQVDRLVEGTIAAEGGLDILVANAGIYVGGDLWDSDPDELDRLLTTNVNGVIRTVRVALPHMIERGTGDVLVTSSVSGHQAIHWEPVYSASKHALQAFVHGVRRQLIGTGVRAGAIAPGIVLNDLWGVSDPTDVEAKVAAGEGIRSEDVADAAAYMLTRPRHVTIRDLVILPRDQPI